MKKFDENKSYIQIDVDYSERLIIPMSLASQLETVIQPSHMFKADWNSEHKQYLTQSEKAPPMCIRSGKELNSLLERGLLAIQQKAAEALKEADE